MCAYNVWHLKTSTCCNSEKSWWKIKSPWLKTDGLMVNITLEVFPLWHSIMEWHMFYISVVQNIMLTLSPHKSRMHFHNLWRRPSNGTRHATDDESGHWWEKENRWTLLKHQILGMYILRYGVFILLYFGKYSGLSGNKSLFYFLFSIILDIPCQSKVISLAHPPRLTHNSNFVTSCDCLILSIFRIYHSKTLRSNVL